MIESPAESMQPPPLGRRKLVLIKIYSELGHGTSIKLYLPRAKSEGEERPAEPDLATPTDRETILVVEDNPNVRRAVICQRASGSACARHAD